MSILLILGVSSAIAVSIMALSLSNPSLGYLATVLATLLWVATVVSIVIWGFSQ